MKYLPLLLLLATTAHGATLTLSWEAPTQNEDGTPLTDLAGYRVYELSCVATPAQGTDDLECSSGWNSTLLAETGETTAPTEMAIGDHFFAVTAYDQSGNESARSKIAFATLLADPSPNAPTGLTVTLECDGPCRFTLTQ